MQQNEEKTEVLSGTVEGVIYKNPENGYIVLVLDCDNTPVEVVGVLGDIVEGESLILHGNYTVSQKYGRQFKAAACERRLPETAAEIRKYLGSGIFKGIGPAMAKKIVAAFGEESLDIIENDPHRLASLNGITIDRALSISTEFRKACGMKSVIEFLQKYDIGPITASLVWRVHEGNSVTALRENPYLLCGDEFDIDFGIADKIASDLGLSQMSKNRIKAGISYVLHENSSGGGHTCLPREKLCEAACRLLGTDEDDFDKALFEGINEGIFAEIEIKRKSFIYLREYYIAENYIAMKLADMLKLSVPMQKDYADEIKRIEEEEKITYEEKQKAAINAALGNKLFILTGGPGTGKTTTLNAIIKLCRAKRKKLMLAAPTGRAAKRMSDLTGQSAKTIHRMLEVDFSKKTNKLTFKHNERNPLGADVIIIDEMSMVDVLLFDALLRAVKNESSLILVGDSNQLPSVGAGNVLGDLISEGHIPTIELTEIFRQAAESLIVTNAHRIVHGELPDLDERKKDFFFMETDSDEATANLVLQLVNTRLPKTYGYSPFDDIQVLSPTRIGMAGTNSLNKLLQNVLNPSSGTSKKEMRFYNDVTYRIGDKVMQIKNDYDVMWKCDGKTGAGVFNGDIGRIIDIDVRNGTLTIDFEGRVAVYTNDMLNKIEHAYAVTIHKSQGSEYKAVIISLTTIAGKLLYRNLLYTGVTRAKEMIIIVGSRRAVTEMVNNNRRSKRYSRIKELLEENMG